MSKVGKGKPPNTAFVTKITPDLAISRLTRLLERVPSVIAEGKDGPGLTIWRQNVEGVLSSYYGTDSLQFDQFKKVRYYPTAFNLNSPDSYFEQYRVKGLKTAEAFIHSRIEEIREEEGQGQVLQDLSPHNLGRSETSRRVFVVHGHDHGTKETIARFLERLDLEPIILHEQPDRGRTIIEKFEDQSDVACAIVILTPDDVGSSKEAQSSEERARQNVVFELGFFIGRLGRSRTFALLKQGVTKPSDFDGVLYIPIDDGAWKLKLVQELKAANIQVDANRAFNQ